MSIEQFKLPDIGEGLTEADILGWRVAVGDTVEVNQVIVEVETAKAAVELPSPYAGVVTALHVQDGQTVDVGSVIISIETGGEGPAGPAVDTGATDVAASDAAATGAARAQAAASDAAVGNLVPTPAAAADSAPYGVLGEGTPPRQPVLVGYGPAAEGSAHRRRRRSPGPVPSAHTAFNAGRQEPVTPTGADAPAAPGPADELAAALPIAEPDDGGRPRGPLHDAAMMPAAVAHHVLAKPPVRKLAKSLGVDLSRIRPTGPNGTVSRDDVTQAAGAGSDDVTAAAAAAPAPRSGARETRVPVRGVRKHTAAAMVSSVFTAPHVTEFVTIDVSATMALRDRVAARREFAGVKVSPLLFLARAVILAARRTPEINATWDADAGEIVLKHYVNLGIAAATGRGLVVPNIKNADALGLRELAGAIGELTETARAGRTTPADMAGGTITITNVGVFGVDTGTPILNPGETGIVAFGAIRRMPWVVAGADGGESIEPRWVTQLAVSFDHRVVDGQQGSQFLADVAALLTDPGLAML